MTGPTFSPDGQWMWDGNAWIPAPPQANVLPQASLNQNQISTVANNAGVPVNQLSNTAPYFDQNRDGILQNTELQQAAAAIAQPPTMPVPVQSPQPPVMQQPMVQQPMVQQPMVQQPMMQQPMMQQPMMQQPMMQQPMMQQPMMQQPVAQYNPLNPPMNTAILNPKKGNNKIIFAIIALLMIVISSSVFYVWKDNIAPEYSPADPMEGTWLFCSTNCATEFGSQVFEVTFSDDESFSGWTDDYDAVPTKTWSTEYNVYTEGNDITLGYKFEEGWYYQKGQFEVVNDLLLFVSLYTDVFPNGTTSERQSEGNTFYLTSADKHPAITSSPEIYLSHLESMGIEDVDPPSWWISDLDLAGESAGGDFSVISFEVFSLEYDHTQDTNEPLAGIELQSGDDLSWASVLIQLSVNNGAYQECSNPEQSNGGGCAISDDNNGYWLVGESVSVSEGITDLCDGGTCEVRLKILDRATNKLIYESMIVSV